MCYSSLGHKIALRVKFLGQTVASHLSGTTAHPKRGHVSTSGACDWDDGDDVDVVSG